MGAGALTAPRACDTLRHMKTITIRELHARTGEWVRLAARHEGIAVTDRGRPVARIVPAEEESETPYFARRQPGRRFAAIMNRPMAGPDSTEGIGEDRDAR